MKIAEVRPSMREYGEDVVMASDLGGCEEKRYLEARLSVMIAETI